MSGPAETMSGPAETMSGPAHSEPMTVGLLAVDRYRRQLTKRPV